MANSSDTIQRTESQLADVLAELIAREQIFQWPEVGTSRTELEDMMLPEFCEVGASGRRYSREFALKELERRAAVPKEDGWETREFRCQSLAENAYLLTYTLVQDGKRRTRRSTIWEKTAEGWKVAFHQGTIVEDAWNECC